MGLEHNRHRSPVNAFVHTLSCLAACSLAQTRVNIGLSSPLISPELIRNRDLKEAGAPPGWAGASGLQYIRSKALKLIHQQKGNGHGHGSGNIPIPWV